MKPHYQNNGVQIFAGDVRAILPCLESESVQCVVTSPPYWGLRDYGCDGQLGLERTPELYVSEMVAVFREVRRVLKDDGTLWLNMGDSYQGGDRGNYGKTRGGNGIQTTNQGSDTIGAPNRFPIPGLKPKDLCGVPWMLAFALRADGWYLRSDIIWHKPNPMPESVIDRPTKSHEYLFLLSKNEKYYYDADAIKEAQSETTIQRFGNGTPRIIGTKEKTAKAGEVLANSSYVRTAGILEDGRNKRTVWTVATQAMPEAHFATFPEELIRPCILAGCPAGGTVLDPFGGSGTTAVVATQNQCKAILVELSLDYIAISAKRLSQEVLQF